MSEKITSKLLLRAYSIGVFPMAESRLDPNIFWVEPKTRGIIPLDQGFHLPARLARTLKRAPYRVSVDEAFEQVVLACAEGAEGRTETWINDEIIALFSQLAQDGIGHSIECWLGDDLVGGLYGLELGGAFFGESMFHTAKDASKIALCYLVARLLEGGFVLLDVQFITDHLRQFGATETSRETYLAELETALEISPDFHSLPSDASPERIVQLITQTS